METETLAMTLTGTITHIVARRPRPISFGLDNVCYTLSGFAARGLAVPPIGTRVAVRLDRSGFVQEITAVAE